MALPPQMLAQILRMPKTQDVTESPIVRAMILNDASNAAELVEPLEQSQTLEAYNARRILCLFEADAVPHLLAKLATAGPIARKEGLEILWALLAVEEAWKVREILSTVKPDLDKLLDDTRALPDDMPEYIERDFRGRICDLAFIVASQLINREYDQSLFRSLDDRGRNEEIRRFKARGFALNIS